MIYQVTKPDGVELVRAADPEEAIRGLLGEDFELWNNPRVYPERWRAFPTEPVPPFEEHMVEWEAWAPEDAFDPRVIGLRGAPLTSAVFAPLVHAGRTFEVVAGSDALRAGFENVIRIEPQPERWPNGRQRTGEFTDYFIRDVTAELTTTEERSGMTTLREGDRGEAVAYLQRRLNIQPSTGQPLLCDGEFGPKTTAAVIRLQEAHGLLVDGIVGSVTWDAMGIEMLPERELEEPAKRLGWAQVDCDKFGEGYDRTSLREDVAPALEWVRAELNRAGAILTSSGGRRALTSLKPGANQSAKSLHLVGLAHDLFVYSGMVDPATDPYVVVREGKHWRVFAKADQGSHLRLAGWVHREQREESVAGTFVDLTAIMAEHGFQRIRCRPTYGPENYGASEWWHFQHEASLVPDVSSFGEELLRIYSRSEAERSAAWKWRGAIWKRDWF